MSKEIKHEYTEEIVCPYCGREEEESWKYDDYGHMVCEECGETFYTEKHIEVSYSTEKVKELENEK